MPSASTATTAAVPPAVADASWTTLLHVIPNAPDTRAGIQLEKPQLAVRERNLPQPAPGASEQAWTAFMREASDATPGISPVGVSVYQLGTGDQTGANYKIFGIDPASISAEVSAGGRNQIGTLRDFLALAGSFDPGAIEQTLTQRYGAGLESGDYRGTRFSSWPSETAIPGVPAYSHIAASKDVVLIAPSQSHLEQMIDAQQGGGSVIDDEAVRLAVVALEQDDTYAAGIAALDGAVLYERAQQWINRHADPPPDPNSAIRPFEPGEVDALANQTVLLPYQLLGVGWMSSADSTSKDQYTGTFVLVNADPETAAQNAGRFGSILREGRSVKTISTWSTTGFGPVHEVRSQDRVTVAVMEAVPGRLNDVVRDDILFASKAP